MKSVTHVAGPKCYLCWRLHGRVSGLLPRIELLIYRIGDLFFQILQCRVHEWDDRSFVKRTGIGESEFRAEADLHRDLLERNFWREPKAQEFFAVFQRKRKFGR